MYGLRLWASVVLYCALIERNNRFFDQCWVAEVVARDQDKQSNPFSSKLRSQRTIRHSQLRLSEKRILSVITFYWTYRTYKFVLSLFFAIYLPCYYGRIKIKFMHYRSTWTCVFTVQWWRDDVCWPTRKRASPWIPSTKSQRVLPLNFGLLLKHLHLWSTSSKTENK